MSEITRRELFGIFAAAGLLYTVNSATQNVTFVRARLGTCIEDEIRYWLSAADRTGMTHKLNFNGISVVIAPGSTVESIYSEWTTAMERGRIKRVPQKDYEVYVALRRRRWPNFPIPTKEALEESLHATGYSFYGVLEVMQL